MSGEKRGLEAAADEPYEDGGRGPLGPFSFRHLDSLSLLFYQATPASARSLPAGSWKLSTDAYYASFSTTDFGSQSTLFRDHEVLRLELRGQVGLRDDLELEVVVPFHFVTIGILDDFVDEFHDLTGLGPDDRESDAFADSYTVRGQTAHQGSEDLFSLADISLSLKYAWLRDGEDPLGLAIRGGVELPAGSESRGVGNGEVDGGFGVLLEKSLGDFVLHVSGDAEFQQPPDDFESAGIDLSPVTAAASLGLEWRARDELSFLAQVYYSQPLLPDEEIPSVSGHRLYWALGFRAAITDRFSLRFAFMEELISGPVFDFAMTAGLSFRF
ncbi:MAG: DUF3187 family protein [Planctomycetota bacterium]|nr:DUF3187 family protein [Planctomycetota bacterium]